MALSFLLDTSVLKRLGRAEVRSVVEPLAAARELGRPSICDLEVGYSARNGDEWDRLVGALDVFDRVETTAAHLSRALQVQRLLAQRSQRGRKIPDLLIAAAAEQLDLTVLHYDADFDAIAAVTGQQCRWVVPAGSVH
ncbi:MAG: PIN domain nuclease [Actinomycetota bacterium]|nr:PIN domain nuclease [Actinomycetota bacterium]